MSKYCLLTFLILSGINASPQQTVQFSQYVFNGLAVNPAYAGYKDDWTANLSFRIQWAGFEGAPKTGTFSLDGLASNKNIGLGIIATSDKLGPQSTSSVYVNYAYRLQLDEQDTRRLCFGLAFGAVQYKLDASKFNPADPVDNNLFTVSESRMSPDLRLGLYYYAPRFYFGASMLNVLQNSIHSNGMQLIKPVSHVYLSGGMLVPLSSWLDLKPSFVVKEDFRGPTNLDLTNYLLINKKLWLGASWRTATNLWRKKNLENNLSKSDAIATLMQVYVNEYFRIGYSYDFTTSRLSGYQNGTHEISIGLSLNGKKDRILSPRFF